MVKKIKKYLVTGGLGFIASQYIFFLLKKNNIFILNIDKCTYASNPDLNNQFCKSKNYQFKQIDISNKKKILKIVFDYKPDIIVNFAAETHVDNSIKNSFKFTKSNILGTQNLLEAFRNLYKDNFKNKIFFQISTDEVFGDVLGKDSSREIDAYSPSSPYSSSKASADMFVKAWHRTYNIPFLISYSCNNFGPFQNSEKFIPVIINSLLKRKQIPIYGDGKQTRDWIYVKDNIKLIDKLISSKIRNESFNLSLNFPLSNIELCKLIFQIMKKNKLIDIKYFEQSISFVNDRPGHDIRYSISNLKLKKYFKINNYSKNEFEKKLKETIFWYYNLFMKKKL